MSSTIYLRPLQISDASVSYKWRNNPLIWKFTRFRAEKPVTLEVETQWIEKTLTNEREHRFAICLKENHKYVGNVQLVNVENGNAVFHLFIGETGYWGQGIGQQATLSMLVYGFNNIGLDTISLEVHKENMSAYNIYTKMGFEPINEDGDFIEMILRQETAAAGKIGRIAEASENSSG